MTTRSLPSWCPSAPDTVYGMKWLCSYEDHYHPIPKEDLYQNIYAFPCWYMSTPRSGRSTPRPRFGDYGGSNLQSTPENPSLLRVHKATDKLDAITSELPMKTPGAR